MRWKWLTGQEKRNLRKHRQTQWRRKFALLPRYDENSRTAYWFEWVWLRGYGQWIDGLERWEKTEYRGGRDCPELKQPPGWLGE